MKTSTVLAAGTWALIVGGNVVQAQLMPSDAFMGPIRFPWPIIFMPLVIVFGAVRQRSLPGETVLGRQVDRRFGPGTYRGFMDALRPELMFAAMCFGIVLSALARATFRTPAMPPEIIGFFASGGLAFLAAHVIRRRREAA